MKLTSNNELLEICNDEISAKRAGYSKIMGQEYSVPSLTNLVAAAATKIENTIFNTKQTEFIKMSLPFDVLSRLRAYHRPTRAAKQGIKWHVQDAITSSRIPVRTLVFHSLPLLITLAHRQNHDNALVFFSGLSFPL